MNPLLKQGDLSSLSSHINILSFGMDRKQNELTISLHLMPFDELTISLHLMNFDELTILLHLMPFNELTIPLHLMPFESDALFCPQSN